MTEVQKIGLAAAVLLGVLCAVGLYFFPSQVHPPKSKMGPSTAHFLDQVSWATLSVLEQNSLKIWNPEVIKVIFELSYEGQKFVLVSRKRSPRSKAKNFLWEFPGGKIEKKDAPIKALLRELKEEDPSGVLRRTLKSAVKNKPDSVAVFCLSIPNGENHVLVRTPITFLQWQELHEYFAQSRDKSGESRGFFLVGPKAFDLGNSVRRQWTPKSRKILDQVAAEPRE